MRLRLTIPISLGIIILNNLIGHFYGPNGILLTPIVIVAVTVVIVFFSQKINSFQKSLLIVALIALNDIGKKLYSEGSHDKVGLAWVLLYMLIGVIPAFGLLIWAIIKEKKEKVLHKMITIAIFPILIILHIYLFQDLGFGRYYSYE